MRKYGKWALSLGLMAATPALGLAAPWSRDKDGEAAEKPKATTESRPASKATNQQMADKIAVALRDARLQGYDIEIEYKEGTAILKGRVTDPKQKEKASAVVGKIAGISKVDNQLVLAPKSSVPQRPRGEMGGGVQQASHAANPREDRVQQVNYAPAAGGANNQAAAEQIAAALTAANLDGYDIEIRYQDGVCQLAGSVGTLAQREAAERVVSQVPGVMQVQNQLRPMQDPRAMGPGAMGPGAMGPQGPMMGPGPISPDQMGPGMGPQNPWGPQRPPVQPAGYHPGAMGPGAPMPAYGSAGPGGAPAMYNSPSMPDYAWPSYAQYPNSAQVNYPTQYSASAWPYIGPFYPYPQVPLGWRDASLRWDDGQWNLQFRHRTDKWWWFLSPKNW